MLMITFAFNTKQCCNGFVRQELLVLFHITELEHTKSVALGG